MDILHKHSIHLVLAIAHEMDSFVVFLLAGEFTIKFIVCSNALGIELGF